MSFGGGIIRAVELLEWSAVLLGVAGMIARAERGEDGDVPWKWAIATGVTVGVVGPVALLVVRFS